MTPLHSMGELLGNGATVVEHSFTTEPDGSTREIMFDSQGNRSETFTHGPGTPGANQKVIATRVDANLREIERWIEDHPEGALLSVPETLTVVRMLAGLCRILHRRFDEVGGA